MSIITEDLYKDNNKEEILGKLKNCQTIGNVKDLINQTFPDWIVAFLPYYSDSYPHLNRNWLKICEMQQVKPTEIIIVSDIIFDDEHIILKSFCECLTRAGFCVRRKIEFIPCSVCNKAIPTQEIYNLFVDKQFEVPERWSPNCFGCQLD